MKQSSFPTATSGGSQLKALAFVSLLAASAAVCQAGMTLEQAMSDEDLIRTHYPLVIVVQVTSVSPESGSTNADPPVVTAFIEEVIKGQLDQEEVTAVWRPPDHDVDWAGEGAAEALQIARRAGLDGDAGTGTVGGHAPPLVTGADVQLVC